MTRCRGGEAPWFSPAPSRAGDFPGCESFHLPASEVEYYEGRLEFWDGVTETAWRVCEPTSIQHEQPASQLAQMAGQFAMLRGSRIVCLGSSDLVRRDASGRKRWLMQADQVLYLHPERVRLQGPAIEVDADPLPDVVLEVDHTTDVRRRKLGVYMESGFPEIWVLVPWDSSVRAPGLAIHVRRGDGYREESSSRAFSGWRAEEIHRALTEAPLSEPARRALERTARAMGAREGTTPQHDPLMASESARMRARSHVQGHREGHAQGRMGLVAAALRAPGHRSGPGFHRGSGAPRRTFGRGPDGGGAVVHGRDRFPPTNPRAGRHAGWGSAPKRSGMSVGRRHERCFVRRSRCRPRPWVGRVPRRGLPRVRVVLPLQVVLPLDASAAVHHPLQERPEQKLRAGLRVVESPQPVLRVLAEEGLEAAEQLVHVQPVPGIHAPSRVLAVLVWRSAMGGA